MNMKRLQLLFVGIATVVAVLLGAQSAHAAGKIIIIDGYFFDEIPVSTSSLSGLGMIKTPGGTKATKIVLSEPLPEAALKYAIPADQIPEAEELLQLAETARIMPIAMKREDILNVGDQFPEFTATDIDGRKWSNADVAGKPMVLNLWFTGCGPCRSEMPVIAPWKDEMPDVMFFSSTYEPAETARPVIEKFGFSWTALVGDEQFKQWIGSNGYPMTVVVDKSGKVAYIEYGTSAVQREELKKQIEAVR